ncbi:hypothetical protein BV22DRAFT_1052696, partial [Leucogyrophana mollusca]
MTKGWSRPSVLQPLKSHLIVFKPQLLPQVVQWTSYGICCLLEDGWKDSKTLITNKQKVPPYMVETISMLERTLNFGHTGNARVLTRGTMEPAWLSMSLLQDGLPSISPMFALGAADQPTIKVRERHWPIESATGLPRLASQRSQILTYGNDHLNTYLAIFQMAHARKTIPREMYAGVTPPTYRISCYLAHLAMRSYIEDVRKLVFSGVMKELELPLKSSDPAVKSFAKARKQSLNLWRKDENILTYSSYMSLVRACASTPEVIAQGLVLSNSGTKSLPFFVDQLYRIGSNLNVRRIPPIIGGGAFLAILRVAVEEIAGIARTIDSSDHTVAEYIKGVLIRVCTVYKINYVPWCADPTRGQGRPKTTVLHNVWLSLGDRTANATTRPVNILSQPERDARDASKSLENAQLRDSRAPWSCFELGLRDLYQCLNSTVLPDEWSIENASIPPENNYVRQTYVYVRENYNGGNPIHQLAILVAVIFAATAPHLFNNRPSTSADGQIADLVRNAPWVERPSRKGTQGGASYITMMSTFIIALYEKDSPLRLTLAGPGHSLGEKWTSKHGHKGITPFNLARMGIVEAKSIGIFSSPKYNTSWGLKRPDQLEALHRRLCDYIKKLPYGPYDAVSLL